MTENSENKPSAKEMMLAQILNLVSINLFYQINKEKIESEHWGKFIAINNNRIVAVATDRSQIPFNPFEPRYVTPVPMNQTLFAEILFSIAGKSFPYPKDLGKVYEN